MARLPPLPDDLPADVAAAIDHMADSRAHADGSPHLGSVYLALFHNPPIAQRVGALGEQIRFRGVLPDDVRELVILHYAARCGYLYEVAHHRRPARQAGVDGDQIEAVVSGEPPSGLRPDQAAALRAADAVRAGRSIPADVQQTLAGAHGLAGVVEVVAICGLYAIMGYTVAAFDIGIEPDIAKLS